MIVHELMGLFYGESDLLRIRARTFMCIISNRHKLYCIKNDIDTHLLILYDMLEVTRFFIIDTIPRIDFIVAIISLHSGPEFDGLVLKFFDGHFLKMYVI